MWLFWLWGAGAVGLMAVAEGLPLLGFGDLGGDNSIVFTLAALAGIPAWLILVALTLTRWRVQSHAKSLVQNAPAVVAAALFLAVQWRWAA
jgi:hypothetical protein